jgi:hypothetical protein
LARRSRVAIVDDRLLIEELLVGLRRKWAVLYTTAYWYYRACRAAVLGAGGHLSGPFEELDPVDQERAVASLLELRDDIALPDPRFTVPVMVDIASRHPRLNLLNLEAIAAGRVLGGTLLLSAQTEAGILPSVLDQEGVPWRVISLD